DNPGISDPVAASGRCGRAVDCLYTHLQRFRLLAETRSSPEKRSGKTRLVEVLERLARRPFFVSGISAAALLRVIEKHHPAMLLDELDTLMKGDVEMAE